MGIRFTAEIVGWYEVDRQRRSMRGTGARGRVLARRRATQLNGATARILRGGTKLPGDWIFRRYPGFSCAIRVLETGLRNDKI